MGPAEAVKTCLSNYANFQGRALRSEFWWFYLFSVVIQLVFYALAAIISPTLGIVGIIAGLALIVPTFAVGCRRLHDRDMSGWLQLIIIIPLAFIVLIIFWALKGTEGDNKYGAEP